MFLPQHNACTLRTLTALLFRHVITIGRVDCISFSAIDKLVTLFQNLEKKRFYVGTI